MSSLTTITERLVVRFCLYTSLIHSESSEFHEMQIALMENLRPEVEVCIGKRDPTGRVTMKEVFKDVYNFARLIGTVPIRESAGMGIEKYNLYLDILH
ncbi:hypothetical protein PsYK624_091500 [Phanerochaete sordida]|uniref:Uncharacterized protein n=1 Tax=Phanerochaete sordida TaxID=48140 RepID=A0A9P3GDN2_9APHY|nr:hypothetical protein PsYK624_091500 [Phanerochaete sordida]